MLKVQKWGKQIKWNWLIKNMRHHKFIIVYYIIAISILAFEWFHLGTIESLWHFWFQSNDLQNNIILGMKLISKWKRKLIQKIGSTCRQRNKITIIQITFQNTHYYKRIRYSQNFNTDNSIWSKNIRYVA